MASRVAQDEGHVMPHQLYRVHPWKKKTSSNIPSDEDLVCSSL